MGLWANRKAINILITAGWHRDLSIRLWTRIKKGKRKQVQVAPVSSRVAVKSLSSDRFHTSNWAFHHAFSRDISVQPRGKLGVGWNALFFCHLSFGAGGCVQLAIWIAGNCKTFPLIANCKRALEPVREGSRWCVCTDAAASQWQQQFVVSM